MVSSGVPQVRRPGPLPVIVVLLPVVIGVLVAFGSGNAFSLAAALALAPLVALAVASLSVEALIITLVVVTQVQIARFFLFGFHFLPEHFVLVAVVVALLIRAPQAVFRRAAAYEVLLLVWITWNGVVSVLVSPDLETSLGIVGWLLLSWLIMWVVRGAFELSPDAFQAAARVGAWVASVLGFVAFALWLAALLDIAHVLVQPEFVTGAVGAKGAALEANLFGSGELLWLYWLLRERILGRRVVPPWQVTAVTLGIAASMTRAVWLATIVVLVGSVCIRRPEPGIEIGGGGSRSHRRGPLKVAAGIFIVGLVLAYATPAGQKFSESLNFKSTTSATRLSSWQSALKDLSREDAHVVGLGTNSFGTRHLSPTERGQPDYLSNFPLTLLYDGGVVGLGLFVMAMAAFVMRSRRSSDRLMTGLFVIAVLIAGAATSPIWFGFVWVMVAIIDADNTTPADSDAGLEPEYVFSSA